MCRASRERAYACFKLNCDGATWHVKAPAVDGLQIGPELNNAVWVANIGLGPVVAELPMGTNALVTQYLPVPALQPNDLSCPSLLQRVFSTLRSIHSIQCPPKSFVTSEGYLAGPQRAFGRLCNRLNTYLDPEPVNSFETQLFL